jgi:hypothetical protein
LASSPGDRGDLEAILVAHAPWIVGAKQFDPKIVFAQHANQIPQSLDHVAAFRSQPEDCKPLVTRQPWDRKVVSEPGANFLGTFSRPGIDNFRLSQLTPGPNRP